MMSLETIDFVQRKAAKEAAEQKQIPYLVRRRDLRAWENGRGFPIPFPMLGDYQPPGWTPYGEALFVDTSGFGGSGERSLTMPQLLEKIEPGVGYAFTQQGQFQAYIQPFKQVS